MARAQSEKAVQAKELFNKGMAMVDIAKELGVSDGTVRSWKNRYGWGKSADDTNATLQKKAKRRGAPIGNKNAVGNSGNPRPNTRKHGAYASVSMDVLDEEEQELIELIPDDEEKLLMEQIQLYSIRERRILKTINSYRNNTSAVSLAFSQRSEKKRSFDNDEDKAEYERRIQEKIENGDRLPGNEYSVFTQTDNKDNIIIRLEQELSNIQNKKTKAIETLFKIRMEKAKLEKETACNDTVDAWIAAILGEDE